jgi:tetratricopeptide (TPR) repeat protein
MLRFAHPEYLYALLILPLLITIYLWSRQARKRSLQKLGNPELLEQLMPAAGKYKPRIKFSLLLLALALLIVALANPQVGTKLETVKREGVDIMVALDVSNSMLAEDFKPNRLENAKRQISLMLDHLENDRIGIVVFAGASFLQLPLTTDYSAARLFLSAVDTDIVSVQGTAIGSAIRMSMQSFVQGERKYKVIVVISDGENFEDDALDAAKEAAAAGISIHTIGMGSPQGVPIPVYQKGVQVGFKKDPEGTVVITRLDEVLLQRIADISKGKYIRAGVRQDELNTIFKQIEGMEKKQIAAKLYSEFVDRFLYQLFAALILLLMEFFLSERKLEWPSFWKSILPATAKVSIFILLFYSQSFGASERTLVRDGNRLYKDKQYNEAEVNYRKALEKNKQLNEGQFNLGDALYKQGRYEEAEKQFRISAQKSSGTARAQAYHNLGNAQLKQKKIEDSIQSYKDALKLNPQDQDTKYNLEFARRLLQQQKQQQQNQQQNKNQKKDKKDQKQNQQNDQQQDQKKDQQKQDQQNQKQDEQQKQQQQQQQKQQAEQKKEQISREDAERILQALKNEEKNVQKKLQKKVPANVKVEKDW